MVNRGRVESVADIERLRQAMAKGISLVKYVKRNNLDYSQAYHAAKRHGITINMEPKMCMITEWAMMEDMSERDYLLKWLHRFQWSAPAVARKLGVATKTLYPRMMACGIPTERDLMSFWWCNQYGTIYDHARWYGVNDSTARDRYRRGMPTIEALQCRRVREPIHPLVGLSDEDIAYLESLADTMTADAISDMTRVPVDVITAVTSAQHSASVQRRQLESAQEKLLRDNPNHTWYSVQPYMLNYSCL